MRLFLFIYVVAKRSEVNERISKGTQSESRFLRDDFFKTRLFEGETRGETGQNAC